MILIFIVTWLSLGVLGASILIYEDKPEEIDLKTALLLAGITVFGLFGLIFMISMYIEMHKDDIIWRKKDKK